MLVETPVDTGKARSGWNYTLATTAETGAKIWNDVPYINALNNGHSQQAPMFFIEQIMAQLGELKAGSIVYRDNYKKK